MFKKLDGGGAGPPWPSELLWPWLARKEKIDFASINIVYKAIYDENVPVPCYFTGQTHLACRSYIGRNVKIKEKFGHLTVRQRHYCKNFFAKGKELMKNHIKVCAAKKGITYCFNNGEITFKIILNI